MGKRLFIVLLAVMLGTALFVSCDGAVNSGQERTAMARFCVPTGKSLNRMNEQFKPEDYFWRYTATKADETGLKTGETTAEVDVAAEAGLAGNEVGPFSMGTWTFKLVAYRDSDHATKLYEGETSVIFAEVENTVTVQVRPSEIGVGTIEVGGNIVLEDGNNSGIAPPYRKVVTIKKGGTVLEKDSAGKLVEPTNPKTETEIIAITADSNPAQTYDADAGQYEVTVAFKHASDEIKYGASSVVVQVYSNLKTTVLGTLNEQTGTTTFDSDSAMEATSTQNVPEDAPTVFTVATSPAYNPEGTTADDKNTTVTIPAGVLTANEEAKLTVTPHHPDSEVIAKFRIQDGGSALGGLDLNLMVGDNPVTTFGNDTGGNPNKVTVTTYIQPGLEYTPEVVYKSEDGTEETIIPTSYDPDTGKIVFETTHFSRFFILKFEALNITKNKLYHTLKLAVSEDADNDEIKLVDDVTLGTGKKDRIFINKKVTLDLNGHKVYSNNPNSDTQSIFWVTTGGDFTIKDGTEDKKGIVESGPALLYALRVESGQKLTIESGTYIKHSPHFTVLVNGGELVVNGGHLLSYGDNRGAVQANYKKTNNKVTIAGGEIEGLLALEGGGTYNITDGTFTNDLGTCVYQKSGTLNISGGTFTTTGTDGGWVHCEDGNAVPGSTVIIEACGYTEDSPKTKITGGDFNPAIPPEGANFKNYRILAIDWTGKGKVDSAETTHTVDMSGTTVDYRRAQVTGYLRGGTDEYFFTDENTTLVPSGGNAQST